MIKFVDVYKSFGQQTVLRGLNLHVPRGKITVILGRSGEGKSVLLKHTLGLLRPDKGCVSVDGQDLAALDAFGLNEIRKKFGLLFQNSALFDSMTVFENIAFPIREHKKLTGEALHKAVSELVAVVGLKPEVMHKYPSEISGGMRKRVGLVRAIALKPQILLYDEPTTGLDPIMTDVIGSLILKTQRSLEITSIVISHDIASTYAIADNIVMLHEGQILMEGPPENFKKATDPVIRNFFEGHASAEQKAAL